MTVTPSLFLLNILSIIGTSLKLLLQFKKNVRNLGLYDHQLMSKTHQLKKVSYRNGLCPSIIINRHIHSEVGIADFIAKKIRALAIRVVLLQAFVEGGHRLILVLL